MLQLQFDTEEIEAPGRRGGGRRGGRRGGGGGRRVVFRPGPRRVIARRPRRRAWWGPWWWSPPPPVPLLPLAVSPAGVPVAQPHNNTCNDPWFWSIFLTFLTILIVVLIIVAPRRGADVVLTYYSYDAR